MCFLTRCRLEFLQGCKDLPVVLFQFVHVQSGFGFEIAVLLPDIAVGAVAVVVGRVPGGGVRQRENASARSVAAEKEIISKMGVGSGIAQDMLAGDGVVPP